MLVELVRGDLPAFAAEEVFSRVGRRLSEPEISWTTSWPAPGWRVSRPAARVAAACGLDGDRLHAWSQVIAPFAAIAHLGNGGEEPVIDELLASTR
ncbi:hypothetical protein ACFYNF_38650 [Streptomyces sp. NPDC006641]|uniref:hypothetical protein n=1 Tax=unclassified Streptomyces TaxID=2593676 RepID=UPI003689E019